MERSLWRPNLHQLAYPWRSTTTSVTSSFFLSSLLLCSSVDSSCWWSTFMVGTNYTQQLRNSPGALCLELLEQWRMKSVNMTTEGYLQQWACGVADSWSSTKFGATTVSSSSWSSEGASGATARNLDVPRTGASLLVQGNRSSISNYKDFKGKSKTHVTSFKIGCLNHSEMMQLRHC